MIYRQTKVGNTSNISNENHNDDKAVEIAFKLYFQVICADVLYPMVQLVSVRKSKENIHWLNFSLRN